MRHARTSDALKAGILLAGFALLVAPNPAGAQLVDVPPTWGGDFWSRPRLTGDWGGLRDELGKMGIVFDTDLLLTPQDVVSGGHDTGANFWGNADYTLNVDTGKLGLWPGGFLKISADSGFGSNVFSNSGTIVPVNTAALIPAPDDRTTALMNLTFTQFLSSKFGLLAGKVNTFDLGEQEFYGDYRTQFMNTAFNFPMTLEQLPISAFGGGVIVLPREDVVLSALALDPSGTPTGNDLRGAFSDGVMVVGSGKVTIKPFGLVGHQDLRILLERRGPLFAQPEPVQHRPLTLAGQVSPACKSRAGADGYLHAILPGSARPRPTCQPHEQHLVHQLCLRSVSLAAQG